MTRPGGRRAFRGLAVAGAIGLSLLASACGSSGAKVAQVGTGGGTNPRPHRQTFSSCMRSHGVPNFPDANTEGEIQAAGIDQSSPAFRTAYHSCRGRLEGRRRRHEQTTPELQRQLLAFAKCMRSHGVPKFPDPIFHPDGRFEIGVPQDPNSPSFIAAGNACRGKLSASDARNFFSKLSGK